MLQELDDCEGRIKETWKYINKIIGKTGIANCEIRLEDNDKDLIDDLEIANKFDESFNEVGITW